MTATLPDMCAEGYSLRWAYLRETDLMFKAVLLVEYREHLISCDTCRARMSAETRRAAGAPIIDFDLSESK